MATSFEQDFPLSNGVASGEINGDDNVGTNDNYVGGVQSESSGETASVVSNNVELNTENFVNYFSEYNNIHGLKDSELKKDKDD